MGWLDGLRKAFTAGEAPVNPAQTPQGLRTLGTHIRPLIGCAVDASRLRNDSAYRERIARDFAAVTTENALKMGTVVAEGELFDFSDADSILSFAEDNDQLVRGHTLVWHEQLPKWLVAATYGRDELADFLQRYLATVCGRYRGRVAYWDVVNEILADTGSARDTFWRRGLGPDYISQAFRWAHNADPDAKLFYNEYGIEGANPKSDAAYRLLGNLLSRGVPIHGVGFQMHLSLDDAFDQEAMQNNVRRFAALGIEVHITELDVRVRLPADAATLSEQAKRYRQVLEVAGAEPSCSLVTVWGLSDAVSWVPQFFPGFGAATLFDEKLAPKPAYRELAEFFAHR